ncbi:MAG TPA: hypothetical protein HA360_01555 [Nanoarchaeota archaeon]|nr:hypothetical protein [uncultured archaeon]MBS3154495.1 hypothetical protein [Candidatus Woesearchaeota archaeon]HIH15723.1 hypothetical protein [Nanoarchaeota archaeon]HIH58632.1 hypothetical protein [Nanoarchaeota archaeon]HII13738.1 hypothetical protein [Nanoarchaeota archaeon]
MRKKRFDVVPWLGLLEKQFLKSYDITRLTLEHIPPSLLEALSRKKALAMHYYALRHVPAYKKYIHGRVFSDVKNVPETDKKNYVQKYSYEDRCLEGNFPSLGNIEESSGSSGKATNWIRAIDEEDLLFKVAKFEFFYSYEAQKKNYIVLSAWSSGPWATGLKFCEIIQHYTLVKNTTADIDNIIRSLKQLGSKHTYLIAGYPPFLKILFDRKDIRWKDYTIDVLTGGESNSLEWKRYIRKKLGNQKAIIISSYGASDIDIGIGFETPFSEFIRELSYTNPELNKELFGVHENPILFQYNPLMHYIENTPKKDFTITLLDPSVYSPKIKYNLHDRGGSISYESLLRIVEGHEKNKLKAFLQKNKTLKLPFLFVVGRVDGTISIGGNNIYPEQIGIAIQNSPVGTKVNRFMLASHIDTRQNANFHVYVELKKGVEKNTKIKTVLEKAILDVLLKKNLEYSEYYHNHKANQKCLEPHVFLYAFDQEKMFKNQDGKIKNQYILR